MGQIATGSFTGGGNQCILHCKPPGHRQVNYPTFQHEAPTSPRFKPAASEVEGENSKPLYHRAPGLKLGILG